MTKPDPTRFPWRNALLIVPVLLILLGWSGGIGLCALLLPGWARHRVGALVRPWGRFGLRALGVHVELEGAEHLYRDEPRIVLFNHVSLLDILLLAGYSPDRPLVLYKREIGRVPLFGWAFRATRMIPVDRSQREKAIASLAEAGRRIKTERAAVMMSPEGTRSRSGMLGQFKLGAFHLACRTGVPIVPLIMLGIDEVLPHGSHLVRPGTVRLRALPHILTDDWNVAQVREHANALRAIFLEQLGEDLG